MAQAQSIVLSNGLTLAVEEQPWNPGLSLQLLLPGGALADPVGLEGAANLLDSWLWKGSQNKNAQALAEAFDDLGVRRSSGASLEHWAFSAAFLPEHLGAVLELCAEFLQQPAFDEAHLEPVRQLALQELASLQDQPARKMFAQLRRAVFTSPHGRNPAGLESDLQQASPLALRGHYGHTFGAKGALLCLAGGVTFEQAATAVQNKLGSWRGQTPSAPPIELSQPHSIHLEQDTAQVQIGLVYPEVSPGHPEFYTARLGLEVLSGGMSSRLFTEVREKRGLVYSVSASAGGVRGYSYMQAYAGTRPERAQETLAVLQQEIERLSHGVSPDELQRAKLGLRTSLLMAEESARSRSSSMARDLFMLGRIRSLSEIEAEIEAVSLDRLNQHLEQTPYTHPWIATLGSVSVGA